MSITKRRRVTIAIRHEDYPGQSSRILDYIVDSVQQAVQAAEYNHPSWRIETVTDRGEVEVLE